MHIINKRFIHNYLKIIGILYLITGLSNFIYSAEIQNFDSLISRHESISDSLTIRNQNLQDELQRSIEEVILVRSRLTEMVYFTRLLEFAVGLLLIFLIALFVLFVCCLKKVRASRPAVFNKGYPADTEGKIKHFEEEIAKLEKEVNVLEQRIVQEQNIRKQMEEEVAGLLARIKKPEGTG